MGASASKLGLSQRHKESEDGEPCMSVWGGLADRSSLPMRSESTRPHLNASWFSKTPTIKRKKTKQSNMQFLYDPHDTQLQYSFCKLRNFFPYGFHKFREMGFELLLKLCQLHRLSIIWKTGGCEHMGRGVKGALFNRGFNLLIYFFKEKACSIIHLWFVWRSCDNIPSGSMSCKAYHIPWFGWSIMSTEENEIKYYSYLLPLQINFHWKENAIRRTCHLKLGDVSDCPSVFLKKRVRINTACQLEKFHKKGLTIVVFLQKTE